MGQPRPEAPADHRYQARSQMSRFTGCLQAPKPTSEASPPGPPSPRGASAPRQQAKGERLVTPRICSGDPLLEFCPQTSSRVVCEVGKDVGNRRGLMARRDDDRPVQHTQPPEYPDDGCLLWSIEAQALVPEPKVARPFDATHRDRREPLDRRLTRRLEVRRSVTRVGCLGQRQPKALQQRQLGPPTGASDRGAKCPGGPPA